MNLLRAKKLVAINSVGANSYIPYSDKKYAEISGTINEFINSDQAVPLEYKQKIISFLVQNSPRDKKVKDNIISGLKKLKTLPTQSREDYRNYVNEKIFKTVKKPTKEDDKLLDLYKTALEAGSRDKFEANEKYVYDYLAGTESPKVKKASPPEEVAPQPLEEVKKQVLEEEEVTPTPLPVPKVEEDLPSIKSFGTSLPESITLSEAEKASSSATGEKVKTEAKVQTEVAKFETTPVSNDIDTLKDDLYQAIRTKETNYDFGDRTVFFENVKKEYNYDELKQIIENINAITTYDKTPNDVKNIISDILSRLKIKAPSLEEVKKETELAFSESRGRDPEPTSTESYKKEITQTVEQEREEKADEPIVPVEVQQPQVETQPEEQVQPKTELTASSEATQPPPMPQPSDTITESAQPDITQTTEKGEIPEIAKFKRYHPNSLKLYFQDDQRPEWDTVLEKNVKSLSISKSDIDIMMDNIIQGYGSKIFVYKKKSSTLDELNELIQMQFCIMRNLHLGIRAPSATIKLSELSKITNAIGQVPQAPQVPNQPSETVEEGDVPQVETGPAATGGLSSLPDITSTIPLVETGVSTEENLERQFDTFTALDATETGEPFTGRVYTTGTANPFFDTKEGY